MRSREVLGGSSRCQVVARSREVELPSGRSTLLLVVPDSADLAQFVIYSVFRLAVRTTDLLREMALFFATPGLGEMKQQAPCWQRLRIRTQRLNYLSGVDPEPEGNAKSRMAARSQVSRGVLGAFDRLAFALAFKESAPLTGLSEKIR
jgi:hypothetical protein